MNRHTPCLLLALALAMLPLATQAEIYKWTDDEGRVHFGNRPADKKQGEAVEVRDYKPGTDASVREVYQRNDRLREAASRKQADEPDRQAFERKQRQAACDEARRRLKSVSGRVIFHDDDGNVVHTTERERAEHQREVEAWIRENCS